MRVAQRRTGAAPRPHSGGLRASPRFPFKRLLPTLLLPSLRCAPPPLLGPSASETLEKRPSSLRPLDAAQDKDKATQAPIHTKADLTGGLSWIECMHKPDQSSR